MEALRPLVPIENPKWYSTWRATEQAQIPREARVGAEPDNCGAPARNKACASSPFPFPPICLACLACLAISCTKHGVSRASSTYRRNSRVCGRQAKLAGWLVAPIFGLGVVLMEGANLRPAETRLGHTVYRTGPPCSASQKYRHIDELLDRAASNISYILRLFLIAARA